MRRFAWVLVIGFVVVGGWYAAHRLYRCPGCDALDAHRRSWRSLNINDYSYVYEEGGMGCCERIRITVHAGRVTQATVLHALFPLDTKPTIDDVFAKARHEMHVAHDVQIVYDRRYGFPTSVSVNPNQNVMDDEFGFRIEQFRRLAPANA
jgi:Family of unknown function (DUF6174)